jgi:hypothetical protein
MIKVTSQNSEEKASKWSRDNKDITGGGGLTLFDTPK